MRLLREQENVPFLSAEEGPQGRFFENLPYGIVLFNLLLPCLWFWVLSVVLTSILGTEYDIIFFAPRR